MPLRRAPYKVRRRMRLAALTTLRLGGPAERLVEAAHRGRAGRRRARPARRSLLAGGSNVVIADEGVPGHGRARAHARDRARRTTCSSSQAGEPWDERRRPLRRATACRASSACPASPARPARRRSRTSAPTGRTSRETVAWVRVYDRETDAVRDDGRRRVRRSSYRHSVFKYRDRWTVLAVALPAARVRAVRPAALRRAGAHARRPGRRVARRSPTCARRCWACAAARAW